MRSMMANPNASTSTVSSESSEQKATHMADSNMNMLPTSLSHQSQSASDGPVAIMWDIENCPVPSDVCPEAVGGNIRMALRVLPAIKGAVKMFSAYGDFNKFPRRLREGCQRTGVKLIDVPNGRKDAADKAILVDMFVFALDYPPPSSIMLISGDVDFAPALHILGQRGYTVILVIPAGVGVSPALCNAGRFVLDWPSVARGEGFESPTKYLMPPREPPTKYLMPPRGVVADITLCLVGRQINENPNGQNEVEAIVYRWFSQNYNNSRDLSVVPQSLNVHDCRDSKLPYLIYRTSGLVSLPSGLNEVSGCVVSSGNQIESTLWVQPGDLNGLKGQLVKMLEHSGGCLPLIRVSAEYQKFFGRPLFVAEYGAPKLVNLFKKMSDSLFVEGEGREKFVCLRNWKAGPSAPPLILTRKDKKGKGIQEE